MKKIILAITMVMFSSTASASSGMSLEELEQSMVFMGIAKYATGSGSCRDQSEVFGKVVRVEGLLRARDMGVLADMIANTRNKIAVGAPEMEGIMHMTENCDSMPAIGRYADTMITNLSNMRN